MKKLAIVLALASTTGCAAKEAQDRTATPVDVNLTAAPRVAIAPPGTMELVYREAPTRNTAVTTPQISLRPGICEKPRHLQAAP